MKGQKPHTLFAAARLSAAASLALLSAHAFSEPLKNGFDLAGSSIPAAEVMHGGPPRDGIPAIDEPSFESAAQASWLEDDDKVIGVSFKGISRAYPIRILNWHEIVNDVYDGTPVLVTFCPLCGTGIVFLPEGEGAADFGVSGLLYNSDVLLYDRATDSLWSQVLAESVSGPRVGERLEVLPSVHTTWGVWRNDHPDSVVLTRDTGHSRDYDRDPYVGYEQSDRVFFPLGNVSDRDIHPKERVMGVRIGAVTKAYPYGYLDQKGEARFEDAIGGTPVVVHWDGEGQYAWATDAQGAILPTTDGFWFAWYAFYPDTEVLAKP